jgi:hypothetical protein
MYLRQDEGFWGHPKTLALGRVLKNPEGGAFIQRVWAWAVRSAPDGDLSGVAPEDIEQIARYHDGPAGSCYAAMVGVGFIDELPGGRRVLHDWFDWTGADVEDLETDARRKRVERRHRTGKCGGAEGREPCPICVRGGTASTGRPSDVRRMSRVVQSSPDQTRPVTEKTGKKEDLLSSGVAAPPPSPAASPTLLTFPTVRGKKSGPTEWHYTEALESELREYFPALDVRSAVREAAAWVRAKPERKKTAGGMTAFLTGWLTRAQNGGQHRQPQGSKQGPSGASAKLSALEQYCDWHKEALNDDKPSRRPKSTCPRCKHLAASSSRRVSTGATPIGSLDDEMPRWAK